MAAEDTFTFLQNPPRRPGLADVSDGIKINATENVPPHMPNAHEDNQRAAQIAALAGMIPLAMFSVEFTAGAPSIVAFKEIRGDMSISDFTVFDNAQGDTTIKWTAGKYPTPVVKPIATLNLDSTPATWSITAAPFSSGGFDGVRVRVFSSGGSGGDLPFTVLVF